MNQPENPTVLLVGNFLSSKVGSHGVCEDLARRLRADGWRVVTTSGQQGGLRRMLDMAWTVLRCRNQYQVAAVDVFSGFAFIWAELVCGILQLLGKPFLLTLRGGNLPAFAVRWPWRVRRLLRSADLVITPSPYLMEEMRSFRADLRLLPNPVDIKAYPFRLREQPAPTLVWLRSFHRYYNPQLAPEVVAQLAPEFPDLRLRMIGRDRGDGSLAETQERARELGVQDRVEFPGGVPKSEVPTWLNQGEIFINTTNIDNTPVSVLEALACGLPVVTTNVGGIPHLLRDEGDALLVPPRDASAMTAAVRRVLNEPGLAARLSRTGRQKVEQYDWAGILPQWKDLLTELQAQNEGSSR